jgi:cell division protein DivIC
MLFFDSNDFITQYQMSSKLSELEETKEDYLKKMEDVVKDRKALMGNPELLEKYAREKYLMKRPNEDVFIIVTKED